MTVTESIDSTHPPIIKHAFRHIGNRGQAAPCCLCGHCLAGGNYSDIELGLDACVTQMQNMACVIESATRSTHATTQLSLRVLHELVDDARKLLCVQRQTARAQASLRVR